MPLTAVLMIDAVTAVIGIGILSFVSIQNHSAAESRQDEKNSGPLADFVSLKALMIVSGLALVLLGFHTFRRNPR